MDWQSPPNSNFALNLAMLYTKRYMELYIPTLRTYTRINLVSTDFLDKNRGQFLSYAGRRCVIARPLGRGNLNLVRPCMKVEIASLRSQ